MITSSFYVGAPFKARHSKEDGLAFEPLGDTQAEREAIRPYQQLIDMEGIDGPYTSHLHSCRGSARLRPPHPAGLAYSPQPLQRGLIKINPYVKKEKRVSRSPIRRPQLLSQLLRSLDHTESFKKPLVCLMMLFDKGPVPCFQKEIQFLVRFNGIICRVH